MLSDGYGDDLEQLLLEKERLLQVQAAERLSNRNKDLWDDLLQEARITIWRILWDNPDAAPAYLHAATGRRLTELVTRQTWTGHTRVHGQPTDPLRNPHKESLDDPLLEVAIASVEWLDSVALAYHHGQILAALERLAPNHRAYVMLRFWGQWTPGEIEPVIGVKAGNQARMWKDSIQPVLARELAHLSHHNEDSLV